MKNILEKVFPSGTFNLLQSADLGNTTHLDAGRYFSRENLDKMLSAVETNAKKQ